MLYKMPDGKVEHFSSGRVWTVSQPQNVAFDIETKPSVLDSDRSASGGYLASCDFFNLSISQEWVLIHQKPV
jgi:hypothetical protein